MADELKVIVQTELEIDKADVQAKIGEIKKTIQSGLKDGVKVGVDVKTQEFVQNLRNAISSANKSVGKAPIKVGVDVNRSGFQKNLRSAISSAENSLGKTPIKITVGVNEAESNKIIKGYVKSLEQALKTSKVKLPVGMGTHNGAVPASGTTQGKNTNKKNAAGVPWNRVVGGKKYKDALENSLQSYDKSFKDKGMTRSGTSITYSPDKKEYQAVVQYQNALGKTASMYFTLDEAANKIRVTQTRVTESFNKQNNVLDKSKNYIEQQNNAYNNLFSKAFKQKNPLSGEFSKDVEAELKELSRLIKEAESAGSNITGEMKRKISSQYEKTKLTIKEKQSAQWGATTMASKDINTQKQISKNQIDATVESLKRLGIHSEEIENTFSNLKAQLNSIDDFKAFQTWQEQLRLANTEAKNLISSLQGQGAKLAQSVENKKIGQIDNILSNQDLNTSNTSGVAELKVKLEDLKSSYKSIVDQLRQPDLNQEQFTKLVSELKTLDTQLTATANTAKKFDGSLKSNQSIKKFDADVAKLKSNFENMKVNWTKALEIPELRTQIEQFEASLRDVDAVNFASVQAQFKQLQANIRLAHADTKSFGTQIKDIFKQFTSYLSAADVIRVITQSIGKMSEKVKELDSAMVELKKITDLTESGYDNFVNASAGRAKDIGTNLTSYIEGVADFVKLGESMDSAIEKSEAANILYKVGDGFTNISESTDVVIASMAAYRKEAKSATEIIDMLNEVSNKTSITTVGLSDALTRSASALSLSGLGMDKSLALIVAGNEATRNASMTGNALKTLSMRIRGATSDLQEAGEEVDDYVKSTSKMRSEILGLTGIDIMVDDGTFKDLYQIMDELSNVYDTLEDIEKANLTEILFGKLRANVGASILQNFDKAEKALQVAQNSAGSAAKEHGKWMQSIEASEARAEAAFEQLSSKIMSSDLIKMGYDAQAGILGVLSGIIDKAGSAIPLVTTLASGLLSLKDIGIFSSIKSADGSFNGFTNHFGVFGRSFKQIGQNKTDNKFISAFNEFLSQGMDNENAVQSALNDIGISAENVSESIIEAARSAGEGGLELEGLGLKAKASAIAMKALATVGNMLATALISWGISKLTESIDNSIHAFDNQIDKLNSTKSAYQESEEEIVNLETELNKVQETLESLNQIENPTFVEYEEIEKLKKLNEQLSIQLEAQKSIAAFNKDKVRNEFINLVKEYSKDPTLKFGDSFDTNIDIGDSQDDKVNGALAIYRSKIHSRNTEREKLASLLAVDEDSRDAEEIERTLNAMQDYEREASDSLNEVIEVYNTLLNASAGVERNDYTAPYFDVVDRLGLAITNAQTFAGELSHLTGGFNVLWDSSKYTKETEMLKELAEQGKLTVEVLESSPDVSSFVDACELIGISAEQLVNKINADFNNIGNINTDQLEKSFSSMSSRMFAGSDKYSVLLEAMDAQAEAGTISVELYQELIAENENYQAMLEATSEGYILNTEALYEYIEAQDSMLKMDLLSEIAAIDEELARGDLSSSRIAELNEERNQWALMINEIDNAIGALSKWKAAKATANKDADFNEGEEMYNVLSEGNKTGKTGTDDFQSSVDFMLGEDWKDRYSDKYKAYEQAEKIAKRYFGQKDERTGMKNFADDLVGEGLASWTTNEAGQKVFNLADGISVEGVAEKLNTSKDAVESLFKLMETYGAEFEWDFFLSEEDQAKLSEYKDTMDALNKTKEQIAEKKGQVAELEGQVGAEEQVTQLKSEIESLETAATTMESTLQNALDGVEGVGDSLSLEEALTKITELQTAITTLTDAGIDVPVSLQGQYDELKAFIDSLLNGNSTEDGGYTFTVNGAEDAQQKINDINAAIETIKANPDISTDVKAQFVGDTEKVLDKLQGVADSGSPEPVTVTIDGDDKPFQEKIANATGGSGSSSSEGGETANARTTTIIITYGSDPVSYGEVLAGIDILTKEKTVDLVVKIKNEEEAQELIEKLKTEEGINSLATKNESGSYTIDTPESYAAKLLSGVSVEGKTHDQIFQEIAPQFLEDFKNGMLVDTGTWNELAEALHGKIREMIEQAAESDDSNETGTHNETSGSVDTYGAGSTSGTENVNLNVTAAPDSGENISNEVQNQIDSEPPVEIETETEQTAEVNYSVGEVPELDTPDNQTVVVEPVPGELPEDAWAAESEEVSVDADATNANAEIDALNSKIETPTKKPTDLDTSSVYSKLTAMEARLSKPVSKTVTIKEVGGASASGTKNAKGGKSLVDEKGAELIEHVSQGTYELGTNDGPRMTHLNPGDVVHTASETKSILSRAAKVGGFFRDGLNKGKAIIGKAFAKGISGSMVWTEALSKINTSKGSSNKNSSTSAVRTSKKAVKNWKNYVEKLFDWIEIRLDRLQTITDKWILNASNAIGYAAKNANLDKALENTTKQISETSLAYERYIEQANAIQRQTKLSNSIVKAIQEGTINIASYSQDVQNKIKSYQEWYDKALSCVDALTELKEQEKELAQEKLDNILNHYQWRIDRLDAVIDKTQESIDLKTATGVEIVESDYDAALDATQKKIGELSSSRATLEKEFANLIEKGYIQEGSEEWNDYTSELEELDQTILQTKIDMQDLKDAVNQITLTNLDYVLSNLEAIAGNIDGMMSLHEAQGSDHKDADYESLINNGMEQIKNLEAQNEVLREQQKTLDVNSEKYQELQDQIVSNTSAILDMKVSQEGWNDAVIDLKIQQLQDYQEELQKINDKFQSQKELQQAIEDLERARAQRTQRVYREGVGFVFEADQDALRNAQENLEQVVENQLLGKIDDLIEALEDSKSDTNVYDAEGNLLGKEYTLPQIESFKELLKNSGNTALSGIVSEAKKAAYEQILNGATSNKNLSISMGDIVVQGVDDANALAVDIVDQFSNALTQALYSKL